MNQKITSEAVIATMVEHLGRSADAYHRAGSDDRRHLAAATLVDITSILRLLPQFADFAAFPAIKDVAAFLADLDHGKSHPWAIPRSYGGSAKLSLAQQELKMRVAVAAEVIIKSQRPGSPVAAERHLSASRT